MVIDQVKILTDLAHVNVALGCDSSLTSKTNTIAVCAGSGASVLKSVEADLYITGMYFIIYARKYFKIKNILLHIGEMSHHDVLDATQRNITVILTNHSNSERGFLQVVQKKLTEAQVKETNRIKFVLSKVDVDPLLVH